MPPRLPSFPTAIAGRRAAGTWLALVGAAVVVDLCMVAAYVHLSPGELGGAFAPSFPLSYKNWVMWALFAPAVIVVVRAVLTRRWPGLQRLLASVALVAGLAAAHAVVELQLRRMGGPPMGAHHGSFLSYHLFHGLLTACVLLAVALVLEWGRLAHQREVREAHLHEQLSRAQLHTLRMQLQPHFLFNTLNSVAALVEEDVRGGQQMISRLGDFLRQTLASAEHQEVPLREELALLATYVEIEQLRFGERLRVTYDVDPGASDARVPNLILQPLVENAIRHGIQPSVAGGTVTVRARREGAALLLEVLDDGVGLQPARARRGGSGVGLANTAERLRQCHGAAASLAIAPREGGGTAVRLQLPLVFAAAPLPEAACAS